jgi:hypothetical protein
MKNEDLLEKAALTAIKKHQEIINHLKDIVTLSYGRVSYLNENDEQLNNLITTDFIAQNVRSKVDKVMEKHVDIMFCYKQMEVFPDGYFDKK